MMSYKYVTFDEQQGRRQRWRWCGQRLVISLATLTTLPLLGSALFFLSKQAQRWVFSTPLYQTVVTVYSHIRPFVNYKNYLGCSGLSDQDQITTVKQIDTGVGHCPASDAMDIMMVEMESEALSGAICQAC